MLVGLTWKFGVCGMDTFLPIGDNHQGFGGGLGVHHQVQDGADIHGGAGLGWLHALQREHASVSIHGT